MHGFTADSFTRALGRQYEVGRRLDQGTFSGIDFIENLHRFVMSVLQYMLAIISITIRYRNKPKITLNVEFETIYEMRR